MAAALVVIWRQRAHAVLQTYEDGIYNADQLLEV